MGVITTATDHSWSAEDGQRAVKATEAEIYIKRLVDEAPRLSQEQLDRLAGILRTAKAGGGNAA